MPSTVTGLERQDKDDLTTLRYFAAIPDRRACLVIRTANLYSNESWELCCGLEGGWSAKIQWMASLVHITAWEKASLWRRILCAFLRVGILVAFLVVLFELLGPPVGFFITSR